MEPTPRQLEWFTSRQAHKALAGLDTDALPTHLAIIMDGNGRWAKRQGKPRLFGHKAGVASVREMIGSCVELGIPYLTIYSFSSENWTRPEEEVTGIMSLFVEVLAREVANLNKQNVRVRLIGDIAALPDKTKRAFEECVQSTVTNTGLTLVVALNYGARQDIASAAAALVREAVTDVTPEALASRLSTACLPDPDLLIRTSGETRLSNFLLYETAYTELYFTDTLWPDFNRDELLKALLAYQQRDRRYGGLDVQKETFGNG
jgi:undecaprenyl diphosphate synthase